MPREPVPDLPAEIRDQAVLIDDGVVDEFGALENIENEKIISARRDEEEKTLPLKPGDDAAPGTPGTGEDVCPVCAGTGVTLGDSCARCLGTGIVQEGIGGA